jgi:hypothetical protein
MTTPSPSPTEPASDHSPPADQTASNETLPEQFLKLVSGDPQFREVAPSGKAFAIIGATTAAVIDTRAVGGGGVTPPR